MPFSPEAYLVIVAIFAVALIIYGFVNLMKKSRFDFSDEGYDLLNIDQENLRTGRITLPEWIYRPLSYSQYQDYYRALDNIAGQIGVAGFSVVDDRGAPVGVLIWRVTGSPLSYILPVDNEIDMESPKEITHFRRVDPRRTPIISILDFRRIEDSSEMATEMAEIAFSWAKNNGLKKLIVPNPPESEYIPPRGFWEKLGFIEEYSGILIKNV